MLSCSACHAENAPSNKFCGACGARLNLSVACPTCHHQNPPDQKFCGECGGALQPTTPADTLLAPPRPAPLRDAPPAAYTPRHLAEKILGSRAAVEGERKQVTVLFSDVSGFTAMSEQLDPEDVHAIMDRVFEVILNAVHRNEGTVNQFLGDGVMALFGAPIAHEDHAHRAIRAALAIQDDLSPMKREVRHRHGVKFRVRMGINTGLVVVGAIGKDLRMDYTAVGDTTNLAARLLSIAGPGQIAISRQTHRLTEGFFQVEDLGEFTVKGKAEPVHAYAVRSEIRGRTRLEVSRERGLTALAGREAEITRLMEAYRRAASGTGTSVLVTGEPGVGKSRLLYELLSRLEGTGAVELEANCFSHGRSMAYHPILELVRRYLGTTEGMSDTEVRERVSQRLRALGIEDDEPVILLGHLLGVSAPEDFLNRLSGEQLKERTFDLLRTVFQRASRQSPLVIVVENLHWMDASSAGFLAHLTAGLAGYSILLLLSARPEFAAPWLEGPGAETITLEGLDSQNLRGMVRTLLGVEAVASEFLEVLLAKGEGNPLFVEEILRQLQESGGMVIEGGQAQLRAGDVRVPETIHDIIAARIDRLAEPVKHTLQVAAVVGRQFSVPLLSRVAEANGTLSGHLRDLQALDFVFPSSQDPEPVYTFKHALTQEVAYTSLLERRRRLYHAAVGAGLEELNAGHLDDVAELLAHHYARSTEYEKAVDYAILAAVRAQRRWANTEALAHFATALKRLDSLPDTEPNRRRRIDAVVKQAEIMFALGRHAEHVQTLEANRGLVEASADPPRRAAWYCWTGFLHSITGARPEVPIAYCREAFAIADTAGLDEIKAFAGCCLTHVYAMAGDLRGALEAGEPALAMFEARGDVWWACRTLWGLSIAAILMGEWDRSLEYCRRALEHGQAVNDRRLKVVSWWRTGWTHIQRGDTEAGLRCCQEALALSPSPFDAAMARAAQGYGMIKAGDAENGTVVLAEAVAWFDQSHLRLTRSSFALSLGDGYLRQGRRAEARAIFEEVLATSRDVGYRHLEGIAHRMLGEAYLPDEPGTAGEHLAAAVAILEEVGARNEHAKALVAQADLRRAAGEVAQARQLLLEAAAIFEALGTLDEPRRVQTALAELGAEPSA